MDISITVVLVDEWVGALLVWGVLAGESDLSVRYEFDTSIAVREYGVRCRELYLSNLSILHVSSLSSPYLLREFNMLVDYSIH